MIQRTLQTIFCDDIRHETSGKLTLVGVYSDSLVVSTLPATLPRLCLVARLLSPRNEALSAVKLRIFKGEALFQELVANEIAQPSRKTTDNTQVQIVQFLVEFPSFEIATPCVLRVHAEVDGRDIYGAPLNIQVMQTAGATNTLQ